MIRMMTASNIQHWDQLIGRLLNLTTAKNALGIAVKQQGQHHLGGIGRTATAFVGSFYLTRIQLLNNIYNKACKTLAIKPTF